MSSINFLACPFNCGFKNYGTGLGSLLLSNYFNAANLNIFDTWIPISWRHQYQVAAALEFDLIFFENLDIDLLKNKTIFLNGDHFSTFFAVKAFKHRFHEFCLVWIDPDIDLNTPYTSPSGNLHGMVVQHLLGNGYKQLTGNESLIELRNLVYVCACDLDLKETFFLRDLGITPLIPNQVANLKVGGPVYISIDLDVICGLRSVNKISYPTLNPDELISLVKAIASNNDVFCIDFNEFNPYYDSNNSDFKIITKIIEDIAKWL